MAVPADMASQGTPSSVDAALRIEGLSKAYKKVIAVENLDLTIAPGELVVILGPSGSGKSTTVMSVAGLVQVDSGRIVLGGRDITHVPAYRRDVGIVLQSYSLFPHMTVAQNVAFPLSVRHTPKQEQERRVQESLELVRLGGFGSRRPRELSGGQQQRVALARALIHNPSILLMDEPLGALDRKLRDLMQVEIKRIQRQLGVAAMYITHDRDEAMTLADRIVVMSEARVQQVGPPREVYEHPRNRFVAAFLGDANIIQGRVVGRGNDRLDITLPGGGVLSGIVGQSDSDEVTLAIRPECLRFTDPEGSAIVKGIVDGVVYRGATTRHTVRCSGTNDVVVDRPDTEAVARREVGSSAGLTCDPDDVVLLSGDAL